VSTARIVRIVRVGSAPDADPAVAEAAAMLRDGGLVAFPTETVYGLGGDARSEAAVERILAVKGRPADNPLIVHVAEAADLGLVTDHAGPLALALAAAFWPGPLTLVLPARPELRRAACRGLATVGVRMPDHPVALALLRSAGIPVAAPSANLSGGPSPTRAADVARDLGGSIPLILDGGPCRIGLESTVLDLCGDEPAILRPGAIGAEAIAFIAGCSVSLAAGQDALSRSPGTRYRHYAPRAMLIVLAAGVSPAAAARLAAVLGRCAHLGTRPELSSLPGEHSPLVAARLYAALRDLDDTGAETMLADEPAGSDPLAIALRERLRRAATHVVENDAAADGLIDLLRPRR